MLAINLIKRTITGVLFVAVMVGGILWQPLSFGILFALISALTIYEFGRLVNGHANGVEINKKLTAVGGIYLFVAVMGFCTNAAGPEIFIPYVLLLIYMMVSELYLKKESPIANWTFSMFSQLYIGLPFALLNVLAFHNDSSAVEYGGISYNPVLPLSVFIFLWLNDTGAYCVGSLIGKHRLFERISPKKSWEGSIGGGIVAIASSFLLSHYFSFLSVGQWAGLALVVVVFGTWGDLTESLLKRQLHVKDSGNILPGHGGMLDRFDSALMAIPASVAYLYLITWL